ncbi:MULTISPECIES: GNAT family protein [unclassified Streptomyces]|jgi:RimJ/RimL family protein N-acetyltransferase|uniref:GNAT family N-acetyltransferase n=1 Tax=unclassified Streptomyces TaxID=2593676 RepID=UPI001BAF2C8C|nr:MULTISPECIES: GNAT family protein [unclassified Streptomyces]MDH6450329.1 RimJ/RimL family protein N-acetyltransferase [Streptomyces sp. SAI-119]MDH6499128.1 RimJ/RimL family protein N-acetyltransferase [Streptomyces sp. SAI-149]QUC62116.1 GNAT family N-acetyltransferase [Streptomyces sp. A2-16]GLP65685.1 acetyltransferase [Streptomyces sp. TUS-ST3]
MSDFSVKPVLTGERTVLRPFTEADAEVMGEIIDDPEVRHFTGAPADEPTPEGLRSWYGSRSDRSDRLDLAVTDRATGELVGEVVLYEWDPAARSCTFRTLVGPRGRGRGLGTEATRLIVGYGFERLGLHRISLEAYGYNARALRVYEKVGFTVEGIRREVEFRHGEWVDEVLMAVLDHEWAALSSTAR